MSSSDDSISIVVMDFDQGGGLSPASLESRTLDSLDELLDKVGKLTETTAERLKSMAGRPDELEFEIGIGFTTGTKLLICAEAQASIKVRVLWKRPADATPSHAISS